MICQPEQYICMWTFSLHFTCSLTWPVWLYFGAEQKRECLSTVLIGVHWHSTTSVYSCKDQSYYSCTHVPAFHWLKLYRNKKRNGTGLVHWLCKWVRHKPNLHPGLNKQTRCILCAKSLILPWALDNLKGFISQSEKYTIFGFCFAV